MEREGEGRKRVSRAMWLKHKGVVDSHEAEDAQCICLRMSRRCAGEETMNAP